MNIDGAETAALLGMGERLHVIPQIVGSRHDFVTDGGGEQGKTRAPVFVMIYMGLKIACTLVA